MMIEPAPPADAPAADVPADVHADADTAPADTAPAADTPAPDAPAAADTAPAAPAAPPKIVYPEPADRPTHYYVVSDNSGFVGAFYSAIEAESVVNKYRLIPFLVQRFEVLEGPVATIWVVLYRNIDAVAYVTNNREEAERVQSEYGKIGLTYTDSIDFWEHQANVILTSAEDRLASISRAHEMYVSVASIEELQAREQEDLIRIQKLECPKPSIFMEKIMREMERITIFDCVVPVAVGGADASMFASYEAPADDEPEAPADNVPADAEPEAPADAEPEAPAAAAPADASSEFDSIV